MKVERGVSQVLFGMLPDQTVDLEGRIWRVVEWRDAQRLPLDQEELRRSLLSAIAPWTKAQNDGGLSAELHRGAEIEAVTVDKDRGVLVESFPRQWRCKECGRISDTPEGPCRCGSHRKAQMQFVAYHTCGALKEPRLLSCPRHKQVAVWLPGTARAQDLRFLCPTCGKKLGQGFPFQPCRCDPKQSMQRNVHRAAEVYSPAYTVLVNPRNPQEAARLRASGGGTRALEWALGGMSEMLPSSGGQTVAGLVQQLRSAGLSEETARYLAEVARQKGEVTDSDPALQVDIPAKVRERAEDEALSIAQAFAEGRIRVKDLRASSGAAKDLYERAYARATREARLTGVDFLPSFPVATIAFGYTRGETQPGSARLVPFRSRKGLRVYGILSRTEALLFRLDAVMVVRHLIRHGFDLPEPVDDRGARLSLLRASAIPAPTDDHAQELGAAVLKLIHSYAHRVVRRLAVHAGIERDSLAEYLLPHLLSFVVYAAARGNFVLGGLQAVFERSLDRLLEEVVYGESRCPLDPGCRSGGGACMACLHLGEPSCRWFNRFLDRSVLFGKHGFFRADKPDEVPRHDT